MHADNRNPVSVAGKALATLHESGIWIYLGHAIDVNPTERLTVHRNGVALTGPISDEPLPLVIELAEEAERWAAENQWMARYPQQAWLHLRYAFRDRLHEIDFIDKPRYKPPCERTVGDTLLRLCGCQRLHRAWKERLSFYDSNGSWCDAEPIIEELTELAAKARAGASRSMVAALVKRAIRNTEALPSPG